MFIIGGTPAGCFGIVFRDRAELDEVIESLKLLRKDEVFLDKPIVYCRLPKEGLTSDESMETYRALLRMVEKDCWDKPS